MTRGRKEIAPTKVTDVKINEPAFDRLQEGATELAVLEQENAARVRAVAAKLRYDGSLHPDALENGARESIRRINMALFELGGYLLLLRETCDHGNFLQRLGRLDLQPRVAQQYMQVTRRFSNANSNSHLESLGKTKLLEMLVLDDEQIDELALTGQTGDLALDDVATMSVKELRATLREMKEEAKAQAQLLADKNARIDKLSQEARSAKQRIAAMPADEAWVDLQREATGIAAQVTGLIKGSLRNALQELLDRGEEASRVDRLFMAGLVAQAEQALHELREMFALPETVAAGDPEWKRWADAQEAA